MEEAIHDDQVEVCGMMHLLISGNFESKDQTVEDVYRNFTLIYKAAAARLNDLYAKFPEIDHYIDLRRQAGVFITFCRCKLRRIFEEDGIMINPSMADLLAEIELLLLDVGKDCTKPYDSYEWFMEMTEMMERVCKVYFEPSPVSCCQLIVNYELMLEFLNQCIENWEDILNKDNIPRRSYILALKENFVVLRDYLELLTDGRNLDKLLIAVENVAYEMSQQPESELECYTDSDFPTKKFKKVYRIGVLKVLLLQPYGTSAPLMSDDNLIRHVQFVQDNLLGLLKNDAIDLRDALKCQLKTVHEGIRFLMHLLITYPSKHKSSLIFFSNIRLDFQALARNIGSVICSCYDNIEREKVSLELFEVIEKINFIKGDIIKTICCMVLQNAEHESPRNDQLGSLILLLQNLMEFMDGNHGMILTWKDHENLVLFTFYLIQNNIRGGNCIDEYDSYRNTLINHQELNRNLISGQVVAFNMACYSLLKRYGKLYWWELYLVTKNCVDIHMRVGILKAFVLSSTTSMTDELVIAYGECVQDSLVELLSDKALGPLKDQFNILHKGLSFLVHLLITYNDDQEKLSDIKVGFLDLVKSIGYVVCSHFNIYVNGDTSTKQSTSEPAKLVEKMNLVMTEVEEFLHLVHMNKVRRESPKTNHFGSLNLLLQNWKVLMECESDLIITWKNEFQIIHENLVLFKSFITSSSKGDEEPQMLCSSIMDVGHVAEYLLTTFAIGTSPFRYRDFWILEFMEHVELIKAALMELNVKNGNVNENNTDGNDRSQHVSAPAVLIPTSTYVVGFEVEMKLIRERLAARPKQLDVISIIGMPGLGKTTLARKVYEDPFTINNFDARAWCCVSQEYNKRDLLLTILGSMNQLTDQIKGQSESELSVLVHKQFKGRRYFIVLDDIWDISIFTDLKCFFPDDNKGSRIMLTSRSKAIGSQVKAQFHSDLIEPRMLTDELSWELMERKVYNDGKCPSELSQVGKEIARKCRGLPLAVIVVGGVLAKGTQTRELWEQVTKNLSLYLARDSQSQFMAALELSYEYLPDCLKPMFLYFGAYPEDKEIHVDKLMRIWMAEGFVQKMESVSLEVQAEANLMDLIDRSLVMVAKRRWDGRVKRCYVHDLLRDMCLVKAKEGKFMQQVRVHSELPDPVMYQRRLSIFLDRNDKTTSSHFVAYTDLPKFSITPPIYSLLFFHIGQRDFWSSDDGMDIARAISSLKLLKVFDAEIFEVTGNVLENDLFSRVNLRYLSFCCSVPAPIPSSISRLQSLETLIIKKKYNYDVGITVPEAIWGLTKLRHLHVYPKVIFNANPESTSILENLQTLSTPLIRFGEEENIFRKVPALKILGCIISGKGIDSDVEFLNFESLGKLESLRAVYNYDGEEEFGGQFKLPITLKKLSIEYFQLKWSQVSIFQTLPNLEVLKLNSFSVEDEYWCMGDDDVFTSLKFLKLEHLSVKRWSASCINFPRMEKLVLINCYRLEEIPSDLGEFDCLEIIDVIGGRDSFVVEMAKAIKKEQEEFGNELLKVYIDTPY